MSKYWALIDTKTSGEKRFYTKQIDYSAGDKLDKSIICVDKSKKNIEDSIELLLNSWERGNMPENHFTPSKRPFLCVTGHSRNGLVTHYQPWYQIKKEVEARGIEFTGK